MPFKKLLITHLTFILCCWAGLWLQWQYSMAYRNWLLIIICTGYIITLFAILANIKHILTNLKNWLHSWVLLASGIVAAGFIEAASLLLVLFFIGILLFKTAGAVKATGKHYLIRTQAGLNCPEYYVLLRITPFTEKQVGIGHLQSGDIKGRITGVTMTRSQVIITLTDAGNNTLRIFNKSF